MTSEAPPIGVADPVIGTGSFVVVSPPLKKGKFSEVYAAGDIENARVPHPDWEEILKKLHRYRVRSRNTTDPYCLMITGGTGVGKTALIDHYMIMNPPYETPEGRVIPILRVLVPQKPTVKAIANAAILKLVGRLPQNKTAEEQTAKFIELLRVAGVEQVIFDEFQHVIQHGRAKFAQEASDWLKNVISESHISVVLAGMPDSEEILRNEQLERRFMNHVRLPKFLWSPASLDRLSNYLTRLEGALPFEEKIGLGSEEMTRRLFYASGGKMGTIMKTIRSAAYLAQKKRAGHLTPEFLAKGYKDQVTKQKKVNPFTSEFDAVVKAAESEARERIARRKREGTPTDAPDPIDTKQVFGR